MGARWRWRKSSRFVQGFVRCGVGQQGPDAHSRITNSVQSPAHVLITFAIFAVLAMLAVFAMIVTPFEPVPGYPERLQSQADAEGLTRSPGLHLSTIYRDIEKTIKPRDEWCTQEELAFFGAGGFLWERVFSKCHAEAVSDGDGNRDIVRPGEFELDGIIGSPDLIRVSDWTLLETKATWRSVNKFDALERWFWPWIVQCKGYAKMIGTDTCEIHVFFFCGDWRPPVPCARSIRLEFTAREIEENWNMIVSHAQRRGWL
jgi:hypothetical protein